MDDWLKTTAIRALLVGLLLLLIVWLFALRPTAEAQQAIKQQYSLAKQAENDLQMAQKTLKSLPQIDQVSIRQLKGFSNYTDQTAQAAKLLNRLSISRKASHIRGFEIGSYSMIIKDTNQAIDRTYRSSTPEDIKLSKRLVSYQAVVAKDLNSVLEYNAAEDMADFRLGSNDSNQRLKLAAQGLSKTLDSLNQRENDLKDSNLSDVRVQLGKMRTALDNLQKSGDTQGWIDAVNTAQDNIVSNRQSFWQAQTKSLLANLTTDQIKAAENQKTWADLKSKYGL